MSRPVLLFHAEGDARVSVQQSRRYHETLSAAGGGDAELKVIPEGNHYNAMIDRGIPLGIQWIAQQSN